MAVLVRQVGTATTVAAALPALARKLLRLRAPPFRTDVFFEFVMVSS